MTALLRAGLPILCGLTLAGWAAPDCAWMLWVESPQGSDHWSTPGAGPTRFRARTDCQRHADELNALERDIGRAEGASGEGRDTFTCLPCTVDPRPEGALLHEAPGAAAPRRP